MKLVLVVMILFLTGLSTAYGQTNAAERQAQSDQLYQEVFKKITEGHHKPYRSGPRYSPDISFYVLRFETAVGEDDSGTLRLSKSLKKAGYRIIPQTSCEAVVSAPYGLAYNYIEKNKKEKTYGLLVFIGSVQWLSDTTAVVRAGINAGMKNAHSANYTFVLEKQGWKFVSRTKGKSA